MITYLSIRLSPKIKVRDLYSSTCVNYTINLVVLQDYTLLNQPPALLHEGVQLADPDKPVPVQAKKKESF